MPINFNASVEDFLKSEPIKAGWAPCEVTEAVEGLSKGGINPKTGLEKPKVAMITLTFTIRAGESAGKTFNGYYPENMVPNMVDLMEGITGEKIDRRKPFTSTVSAATLKNKKVDVLIGYEDGNRFPQIKGYRKFSA